jgi:hypothetical protein
VPTLSGESLMYIRSDGNWHHQATLVGTSPSGELQGLSVALSADGNTAIVGGLYVLGVLEGPSAGEAWVFLRRNGVWHQQGSGLGPIPGRRADTPALPCGWGPEVDPSESSPQPPGGPHGLSGDRQCRNAALRVIHAAIVNGGVHGSRVTPQPAGHASSVSRSSNRK